MTPPVLDFLHDRDVGLKFNTFARWDELLAATPVFASDALEYRLWYLLRYDDVHAAAQDTATFSSASVSALDPTPPEQRRTWIPEELDPPRHVLYRQLLNPQLSPGRVKELEPVIRARARTLVEELAPKGSGDYVSEFGRRFPTWIFMQLMGLPVEQADMFLEWIDQLMHGTTEDMAQAGETAQKIYDYLGQLLADRRAEPRDDIVSYLLASTVEGRPLTDDELLNMSFLLYMAGLDTVAGALSFMWRHFATHPEHRAALIADASLLPGAIEELLRVYGIVITGRVVTRDVEFAGCPMKAGDRVVLSFPSAGRDPAVFDHPTEVVLDRPANRHLAFGAGPHRCVGAHLARAELQIAFEEWHRLIPDYELADTSPPEAIGSGVMGLRSLALRW